MMVTLSEEECGYIAAVSLYFRNSVQDKDVKEISDNIMILEQSGVGQGLLLKIKSLLEQTDCEVDYHG